MTSAASGISTIAHRKNVEKPSVRPNPGRIEGVRTVAFPSISTGIYGYPVDLAAPVALSAVGTWIADHPDALDAVTFVLFSTETLDAFERAGRS